MRRVAYLSIAQIVILISVLVTAAGQTPVATISGSVTDPAGAVIEGAEIIVTQTGTAVGRRLTTQSDGSYRVENLQPGTYRVEVSNQGFTTVWRRLTLRLGDHLTVNFELQPGLPDQRVEVHGEISGVNTSEFKVDGSVSRVQIENLPLNGRSFLELAQLEPGVNILSVTNPGAAQTSFTRGST